MAEVTVEIGGLRTAIHTADAEIAEVVTRRYAGFLAEGPAAWRIEARRRPEGVVPMTDVTVRAGDAPGRLVLERHDFLATLDLRAHAGTLALGAVDHMAVDSFLRVTYSLALLERRAPRPRRKPGPRRARVGLQRTIGQRQDDADAAARRTPHCSATRSRSCGCATAGCAATARRSGASWASPGRTWRSTWPPSTS
jgi:hypothetical protein